MVYTHGIYTFKVLAAEPLKSLLLHVVPRMGRQASFIFRGEDHCPEKKSEGFRLPGLLDVKPGSGV